MLLLLTVLCSCSEQVPTVYTLEYSAGEGGTIEGTVEQTVEEGKNGTAVTAVADEGYEFVKWSDEVTAVTRQDKAVKSDIAVTALFQKIVEPLPLTKTYYLNYNYGEADDKPEQITFVENQVETKSLPVLTREHFTFHGWYCKDIQVADTSGTLLLGNELLENDETEIYAKWTANETATYKILLVYVTKIQATLYSSKAKKDIVVDYTMDDLKREFCKTTTKQLKRYLDEMLDGLVEFEIDEYYTTKTITAEDFSYSTLTETTTEYALLPTTIPEVSDMLANYSSVLAVVDMDDWDYLLHRSSGHAGVRYGEIYLDTAIRHFGVSLDYMLNNLDDDRKWYGDYLDVYVHELIHTIEQRVYTYDYHKAVVVGSTTSNIYERDKAYCLNERIVNGEKVGIPYEFWKGNIGTITYNVSQDWHGWDLGLIDCNNRWGGQPIISGKVGVRYEVVYGESITATARPFNLNNGYGFVKWSDGVTTATRTDVVSGDMEYFAVFEPIDYGITLVQTDGGVVRKDGIVITENAEFFLNVEDANIVLSAVANDGYRFVSWSDGDTNWQKGVRARDLFEIADENYKVTIYAIFEKIE